MKLGIVRLYIGESGKKGFYNIQEVGLAKALAKKGIKIDIFFLVDKKKQTMVKIDQVTDDVRIVYLPARKIKNHGILKPEFLLEYDIDIVHLLSDNQLMVPTYIDFCNKNNIKLYNYIGTELSDTNNKMKKVLTNLISKRNLKYYKKSNVIVKTPSVKGRLECKGIKNIEIIPVGLDTEIIPQITDNKNQLREKLNISKDKKVLIFVGRLEEYKEPIKCLELMKELVKIDSEFLLIMIGKGSLKEKIDKLIKQYNLTDNIILIEKIENSKIHEYYKASDIFLNFNRNEIFGMSILEAMNQGCIVIAKEASGPKYIINNNVDGILIDDYSMKKWCEAISNNINNSEMSVSAHNKIVQEFNWDNLAEKYIELFKRL